MLARYYASSLGRFMAVDPDPASINGYAPQTWNRYAYVLGNPLVYVDQDGQSFKDVLKNPRFRAIASLGASKLAEVASKKLPPGKARGVALLASAALTADSLYFSVAVSGGSFIVAFGSAPVSSPYGPPLAAAVGVVFAGLAISDAMLLDELLRRAHENLTLGTDPADPPANGGAEVAPQPASVPPVNPNSSAAGIKTKAKTPMLLWEPPPEPKVTTTCDPPGTC